MIKIKDMKERGLSVVHDLVDFAKETVKNRKQRKALRTDENESLLPETKTFNGMPLRDYCWLKDEIFRIKLKRRREEGGGRLCKQSGHNFFHRIPYSGPCMDTFRQIYGDAVVYWRVRKDTGNGFRKRFSEK